MRNGACKRSGSAAAAVGLLMTVALMPASPLWCQDIESTQTAEPEAGRSSGFMSYVTGYLNMANQGESREFHPLTQKERNQIFTKSLINPIWYLKIAGSAGKNQMSDQPGEWEQGASGYGKRFADIMGQYAIRKTVMFGFEGLLHEDNRYFPSGKRGFLPRAGYALSSGFLARHDNGKRFPSASLLTGFASGAYLSRLWQPESTRSAGDAATSFGISMGWNIGFGMLKEFLPDMLWPLTKKHISGQTKGSTATTAITE